MHHPMGTNAFGVQNQLYFTLQTKLLKRRIKMNCTKKKNNIVMKFNSNLSTQIDVLNLE